MRTMLHAAMVDGGVMGDRLLAGARRPSRAGVIARSIVERTRSTGGAPPPHHLRVLHNLKAAAPMLGVKPRLLFAIDWLVQFTQPQDWLPGSRPIVWPSQALQCEAMGVSVTQVKELNRRLIDAGLVVMRDSGNRRRYGRRDHEGNIVEAYGFDLSPLMERASEFEQAAAAARKLRTDMAELRRRAGAARTELKSAIAAAAEYLPADVLDAALDTLERTRPQADPYKPGPMCAYVADLEEKLRGILAHVPPADRPVVSTPMRAEIRPHQYNHQKEQQKKEAHTMRAMGEVVAVAQRLRGPEQTRRSAKEDGERTSTRITPSDLVRIAPRIGTYLPPGQPGWPEIIDAADWLRGEMGVSKAAWADACLVMGRAKAAVAVAVVSARPEGHIQVSPGAYFSGLVRRAKTGELDLARSITGLRSAAI